MPVFHGSASGGFHTFSKKLDAGRNLYGKGFYFTEDPDVAATYMIKPSLGAYGSPEIFEVL